MASDVGSQVVMRILTTIWRFLQAHGAGLVLAIAGVALVGYCAGKREERIRQDTASWVHRAQVALGRGDSLQRVSDSLRAEEVALVARAAVVRRRVDTLWRTAESTLTVLHDTARALPELLHALGDCRGALVTQDTVLNLCERRVELERERGDSLARRLREGIPKVDCHWLSIGFLPRCASRTLSFFGGAGLGVIGTLLLHR